MLWRRLSQLWFQEQPHAKPAKESPCRAVLLFLDIATSPPEVEPHFVNIASHYEEIIAKRCGKSTVFSKFAFCTYTHLTRHMPARAATLCDPKLSLIKLYTMCKLL